MDDANREGGFARRAALAASSVLQSRSVFGSRAVSAGVHGDGDAGLDAEAEPLAECGELLSVLTNDMSRLCLADDGGDGSAFEGVGDTPREET